VSVFLYAFNAVTPLLFPMALGWLIARRGLISQESINFINLLCFRYLLAFHLFNSTFRIDFYAEFNPRLVILVTGVIFGIFGLAWLVFSLLMRDRERRAIWILCSFRSNNVILALPLAANLFGEAGLKTTAMVVPITIILFNFFSVITFVYHAQPEDSSLQDTLKRTALDLIRNPLITSCVLGITLSLLRVKLPGFVLSGVNTIAVSATPVSLLLLGSQIDLDKLRSGIGPALGACCLRLILVPAILVPVMCLLGFRGPELGCLVVTFAGPCAVTNLVMARNYRIDPSFAAQTVYLSTVLSIFTLFAGIVLLRGLGLI